MHTFKHTCFGMIENKYFYTARPAISEKAYNKLIFRAAFPPRHNFYILFSNGSGERRIFLRRGRGRRTRAATDASIYTLANAVVRGGLPPVQQAVPYRPLYSLADLRVSTSGDAGVLGPADQGIRRRRRPHRGRPMIFAPADDGSTTGGRPDYEVTPGPAPRVTTTTSATAAWHVTPRRHRRHFHGDCWPRAPTVRVYGARGCKRRSSHVRTPPGNACSSGPDRPRSVHGGAHARGGGPCGRTRAARTRCSSSTP